MSKKNLFRAIIFVVLIYALTFITKLPANLLQPLFSQQNNVQLGQFAGTVWRGSINSVSLRYQQGFINVGQLHWQLKPGCLLRIRVCSKINLVPTSESNGDINLQTQAQAGLNKTVVLQDTDLDLDAAWLLEMAGAPISATGRISFIAEQVQLDQQQALPDINGILSWQQAGIDYPEEYQLGNYIATITTVKENQQPRINAEISDENGLISTNGNIDVSANGQANINLNVAANSSTPESLASLLSFIGQPDSNGNYKIRHRTSLKAIF